jgi:hypothetical protein
MCFSRHSTAALTQLCNLTVGGFCFGLFSFVASLAAPPGLILFAHNALLQVLRIIVKYRADAARQRVVVCSAACSCFHLSFALKVVFRYLRTQVQGRLVIWRAEQGESVPEIHLGAVPQLIRGKGSACGRTLSTSASLHY